MFETAYFSLLGNRALNQDRCAALDEGDCVLLMLSDGMGGHPRGEVAAQILIDVGSSAFAKAAKPIADPQAFLSDILRAAHETIVAFGKNQTPPVTPRATAVLALVQNGTLFWRHLGDSRLYLFRNYQMLLRTRDHSFVESMLQRGIPLDAPESKRYRNLVTKCLGGSKSNFKTRTDRTLHLEPRDILLLCSDGLWGQFPDGDLASRMRHHGSLERMVEDLAHAAERAAAPRSDNVTLMAMRWQGLAADVAQSTLINQPIIAENTDDPGLREAVDNLHSAIDTFAGNE